MGNIPPKVLYSPKNLVIFYETRICPMGGCVICFSAEGTVPYNYRFCDFDIRNIVSYDFDFDLVLCSDFVMLDLNQYRARNFLFRF